MLPFYGYYPVNFCDVLNSDPELQEASMYSISGYFSWEGIYSDGYSNTTELFSELRSTVSEGWTVKTGGPIAAFEENPGQVTTLSQLDDSMTATLRANAAARAKEAATRAYSTLTFSEFETVGEYLLYGPEDGSSAIVCIAKSFITGADGTTAPYYFGIIYNNLCITDGVLMPEEYSIVTDSDNDPFGSVDLTTYREYYSSECASRNMNFEYRGPELEAEAAGQTG